MGFPKESLNFFKIAKRSNFAVKCDWKSKTSQNVQKLILLCKIYGFFEKNCDYLKTANDKKFVLGCNWISKNSQKVEKLAPSWKKDLFSEEKSWVFKNR